MLLEVLPALLAEAASMRGARVVDQQMQRAVLPLDDARDSGRRVLVGEVGGDHRRTAKLARKRDQTILTTRDQHKSHITFTRQPACRRLPDPARGSRDQRHERHRSTTALAIVRRPSISALLRPRCAAPRQASPPGGGGRPLMPTSEINPPRIASAAPMPIASLNAATDESTSAAWISARSATGA